MFFTQAFKTPDARTLASRNLEEAKRELLVRQAAAEHATKMVEYYEGLVNRLSRYINTSDQQYSTN